MAGEELIKVFVLVVILSQQEEETPVSDLVETESAQQVEPAPVPSDTAPGNVAAFTENEHGLNFLGESEVESKTPLESEPQAPAPMPSTEATVSWGDQVNDAAQDHAHEEAGELHEIKASNRQ